MCENTFPFRWLLHKYGIKVYCVVRAIMIMHMENIVGTALKSIDMVSICMVYHNVIYAFLTT